MNDQEKKEETSISPQPNTGELSEEELKKVAGGAPTATAPVKYMKFELKTVTISGVTS